MAGELERAFEEAVAVMRSAPSEAAAELEHVKQQAMKAGELQIAGQAAYALARDAVNRAEPGLAVALIDEAQRFFVDAGDSAMHQRCDLGKMHALDDLGRHAEAVRVGRALIGRLDSRTDLPEGAEWVRAAAEENLGVALGYMGANHDALDAYRNAVVLYRQLDQPEDLARVTANRGIELLHLGQTRRSIEDLTEAQRINEQVGDVLSAAKCGAFIATARLQLGDYDRAMRELQAVEAELEELNASAELFRTRLAIADAYSSANLNAEAAVAYEDLVERFESADMAHDAATARYGLATALAKDGHGERAVAHFARAERAFDDVGDRAMHARSRLERAHLLGPVDAAAVTQAAVDELRSLDRPVELALGQLHLASLVPDEADALIAEAAEIVSTIELPHLRWRLLHAQAQQSRHRGDDAHARDLLEQAIEILSALRDRVGADGARVSFLEGREQVYIDLVDTYLGLGMVADAYGVADTWRAPTLVDRIDGRVAPSAVREASAELNSVYGQIAVASGEAVHTLRERARVLEQELDLTHGAQRSDRSEDPRLPDLGVDPIITYQLIDDEVVAFVERSDNLEVVRSVSSVATISLLLEQLEQHNAWLAGGLLGDRQVAQLTATARDVARSLYTELLAPLLDDGSHPERLKIVPHGLLSRVPFAALHDGDRCLIERSTIVVIPSRAAALALSPARELRDFATLVFAVGDEYIGQTDAEADAVAQESPASTVRRGDRAAVAEFKRLAADFDVLHMSCHGIHRPDSPWFSALRLGDGWLTASELGGLDLNGQLVVLSACESGRQSVRGSELFGLPWGFLAAGAATTIVNLWPTDDVSAAVLMRSFYRHLTLGSAPAVALRTAQLDVLRTRPHPYFWASTTIVGGIQ